MAQQNLVTHTGPGVQGRLSLMPSDRLPKEVVGDIFSKAKDQSILLSMGRQIPVGINETVIRVGDIFPEAGQVGGGTSLEDREGATKPRAGIQYGTSKSFSPIKLAVIVTVSEEYARTNVDGLYTELSTQLSGAIARAADLAVFHGKDALRGTDLLGITNNGFINATTNRVDLDLTPASNAPDVVDQILAGIKLVTADDVYDVTNFAARPSLRADIVSLRDKNGNPVFVPGAFPGSGAEVNINASLSSLLGVPVQYGRSVRGNIGNYAGTDVLMFGGDFSQLAYGYADSISLRVTNEATVGGVSMWETNQIALLAEATFGWYVNDADAFVAFDTP